MGEKRRERLPPAQRRPQLCVACPGAHLGFFQNHHQWAIGARTFLSAPVAIRWELLHAAAFDFPTASLNTLRVAIMNSALIEFSGMVRGKCSWRRLARLGTHW